MTLFKGRDGNERVDSRHAVRSTNESSGYQLVDIVEDRPEKSPRLLLRAASFAERIRFENNAKDRSAYIYFDTVLRNSFCNSSLAASMIISRWLYVASSFRCRLSKKSPRIAKPFVTSRFVPRVKKFAPRQVSCVR